MIDSRTISIQVMEETEFPVRHMDLCTSWVKQAISQIGIVPELFGYMASIVPVFDGIHIKDPVDIEDLQPRNLWALPDDHEPFEINYIGHGASQLTGRLHSNHPYSVKRARFKSGLGFSFVDVDSVPFNKVIIEHPAFMYSVDGFPLVPTQYREAVRSYLEYKIFCWKRNKNRSAYPLAERELLQNNYQKMFRSAYSRGKMPSVLDMKFLSRKILMTDFFVTPLLKVGRKPGVTKTSLKDVYSNTYCGSPAIKIESEMGSPVNVVNQCEDKFIDNDSIWDHDNDYVYRIKTKESNGKWLVIRTRITTVDDDPSFADEDNNTGVTKPSDLASVQSLNFYE